MTANAFEEDRKKSLAAGMNDHLVKPVEPEMLYKSLIKWLPGTKFKLGSQAPGKISSDLKAGQSGPTGFKGESGLEALRQVEGLNVNAGLRVLGGDVQVYQRLLKQFADKCENEKSKLQKQTAENDKKGLIQTAHSLKGTAGNLGAGNIQILAAELEKRVRTNSRRSDIEKAVSRLIEALERFIGALPVPVNQGLEPGEEHKNPDLVLVILDRLEKLLENNDTDAYDLFEAFRSTLVGRFEAQAEKLADQIQEFDYTDALTTLTAMRKQDENETPSEAEKGC
jgi:HPt (histidine-containing phosphotransfer) domain-containing protein